MTAPIRKLIAAVQAYLLGVDLVCFSDGDTGKRAHGGGRRSSPMLSGAHPE